MSQLTFPQGPAWKTAKQTTFFRGAWKNTSNPRHKRQRSLNSWCNKCSSNFGSAHTTVEARCFCAPRNPEWIIRSEFKRIPTPLACTRHGIRLAWSTAQSSNQNLARQITSRMRKEQGPKLSLDFRNPMSGSARFTKTNRVGVGCLDIRTITDVDSAERVSATWARISNPQSNQVRNTFRKPVQNTPDIRIRWCKVPSPRPWSHRATYEINIALDA